MIGGKGKMRTQLLWENIECLEQCIEELKDPKYTSPSMTPHDPHIHHQSESLSLSLVGSPGTATILYHYYHIHYGLACTKGHS